MIFYCEDDDFLEITEKEILHSYWDFWEEKMFKKYGNYTLITAENCIADWITVNWAWKEI